jgi:Zn-dependent protease with chaperone function
VKLLVVFQLIFLTWLVFAATASVAASMASPFVQRRAVGWAPDARHRTLLMLALSPVLLASVSVLAVMSPSALALVWPAFDHCLVHPGHVHLCVVHLPERWANPSLLVGLCLAATFLVASAGLGLRELWLASRLSSRLVASASPEPAFGARILPTADPLCLLVGVFRPSILISRGLVSSVTPDELSAVLSHERAHATRRDTLVRLIARVSTLFMLPRARRSLLQALDLAAEQSSDEASASALGDRLAMAETILKVERLLHTAPVRVSAFAVSFGGTSVPARVAALLDEPLDKRPRSPAVVATLAGIALLVAGPELHHATETLLGFIAH